MEWLRTPRGTTDGKAQNKASRIKNKGAADTEASGYRRVSLLQRGARQISEDILMSRKGNAGCQAGGTAKNDTAAFPALHAM
jgi:hypothetical protein